MKYILLSILLVCVTTSLFSQIETTKKPLVIKSAEKKPLSNSPSLNILNNKPKSNIKILTDKKPDNRPIDPKSRFVNPGKAFEGRFTEKGNKIDPKYKKNQYLGDYKNNGEFVQFICRDHEFVDGDRVQVSINGVIVQPNILLQSNFKSFKIKLEKGFNKIDVLALNQGTSGPNTAEFKVFGDTGGLISQNIWNLATGVKATMIIVKE